MDFPEVSGQVGLSTESICVKLHILGVSVMLQWFIKPWNFPNVA